MLSIVIGTPSVPLSMSNRACRAFWILGTHVGPVHSCTLKYLNDFMFQKPATRYSSMAPDFFSGANLMKVRKSKSKKENAKTKKNLAQIFWWRPLQLAHPLLAALAWCRWPHCCPPTYWAFHTALFTLLFWFWQVFSTFVEKWESYWWVNDASLQKWHFRSLYAAKDYVFVYIIYASI